MSLDTLWQDLCYSFRVMRRSRGFTATAVLTFGLGIGATTAIFTVVNGVLLRRLPFPQPDRLVYIREMLRTRPNPFTVSTEFLAWKRRSQTLEVAGYMDSGANLLGPVGAERVECGTVTASFLPLLGVRPAAGRNFLPEEDRPGGPPVVILGYGIWKRRFGGDPAIVGKALPIDDQSYTVVGVLPESFEIPDLFGIRHDIWMPLALDESPKNWKLFRAIGRLRPGVTMERARAELDAILKPLLRKGQIKSVLLSDWHDQIVGNTRRPLLIFLAAVGFVLLIACVNVANLLLARATAREREMAVRRAMGAGRARIARQLLTESVLLALAGGVAGLALAFWGKDLLVAFLSRNLPTVDPIRLDYRVLVFNLAIALLSGLAFGLAPALKASRVSLNECLKEGGRSAGDSRRRYGLRDLLVVFEITLAMALLIGAGLLFRSFLLLRGIQPGYQADHVLTFILRPLESRYPQSRERTAFFQQVLERITQLPGVGSVGATSGFGSGSGTLGLEGGTEVTADAEWSWVSPGLFRVMGIPLLRGRDFADADREGALPVVIVNQSFAHRYFGAEDPVGKRVRSVIKKGDSGEIIGVVGDVRSRLEREAEPAVFVCYLQEAASGMDIFVRTPGDPMALVAAIRAQIAAVDRHQAPFHFLTMEQDLAQSVAPRRINMFLLVSFAGLALLLGSVGIYGVMSYGVSRRTHEIGVRMALGAARGDVLSLVVRRGLRLVVAGEAAGLAAALALNHVLASMVFDIPTTDFITYAAVCAVWAAVGFAACYIPARRAAKVDPMAALRWE